MKRQNANTINIIVHYLKVFAWLLQSWWVLWIQLHFSKIRIKFNVNVSNIVNICLDLIFLYKFDIWNICQVFDISKTPITMELNYLDILSQKNNSFSWVNRSWYSSFRFSFYASLTKAILWLVFQIYVGKTKISLMTLITIPFTSLLFIMTWNNK